MKAYDLWYELGDEITTTPGRKSDPQPKPASAPDGWIGSAGPGIDPRTWPRGPLTGLPMFHAVTLRLPLEYQRRGPGFPGIAFFQGEGQFAEQSLPTGPGDPFFEDLAAAHEHPTQQLLTDIIDGRFALLWLTEEELAAGPTAPPRDVRRPGEHGPDDEGPNAWDESAPTIALWLLERPDPQAGLAPNRDGEGGYKEGYAEPIGDWEDPIYGRDHLGGTAFPVQALPDGLTPYYLELNELPGLNFGGGNAQIDLESGVFDWACG